MTLRVQRVSVAAVFLVILSWQPQAVGQRPSPWRLVRDHADEVRASFDTSVGHTSRGSVRLIAERRTKGEVAVLQPFRAATWRGKRVRLSGFLAATISSGEGGLVAVINNGTRYGNYHSSKERIVPGDAGWRLLTVTLDVPEDATLLSIGVWLRRGSGTVWLDDVTFDEVTRGVATDSVPRRSAPLSQSEMNKIASVWEAASAQPTNLSFEDSGDTIDDWKGPSPDDPENAADDDAER